MIFFFTQRVSGRKKCGFYLKFYVTIQVLNDLNCVYNVFSFGYFLRKIHLVGGQKWNSTVTFGDKNMNQQLFLLKGAFCSDTIYVTLCVPCSVSAQNQMDEGAKNRRQ